MVRDMCIIMLPNDEWRVGKVLQFCYRHEKTKKLQQYKGIHAEIVSKTESKEIRVLCLWFSPTADPKVFKYSTEADKAITEHSFHPLQLYKYTLSRGCFELIEGSNATF